MLNSGIVTGGCGVGWGKRGGVNGRFALGHYLSSLRCNNRRDAAGRGPGRALGSHENAPSSSHAARPRLGRLTPLTSRYLLLNQHIHGFGSECIRLHRLIMIHSMDIHTLHHCNDKKIHVLIHAMYLNLWHGGLYSPAQSMRPFSIPALYNVIVGLQDRPSHT